MRIFTRVLDSMYGKPAAGVHARLARARDTGWTTVADAETDDDGRIAEWDSRHLEGGLYRIVFDSDGYFSGRGMATAYPEVVVIFRTQKSVHFFRVQVTLAPYSYSTYFGTMNI